jgi:hypothetical protein
MLARAASTRDRWWEKVAAYDECCGWRRGEGGGRPPTAAAAADDEDDDESGYSAAPAGPPADALVRRLWRAAPRPGDRRYKDDDNDKGSSLSGKPGKDEVPIASSSADNQAARSDSRAVTWDADSEDDDDEEEEAGEVDVESDILKEREGGNHR